MNNMGFGIAMNITGNFKKALQGVHSRWSRFRAGIKTGVAGIKTKIAGLGARFKTFKTNMLGVFATVLAGAYAFKKLISISVKFQQSIANVAAISGESQKELAKLAREAGMNTVFSAREAADAMYFLASAGLKTTQMAKVLTPTLNLAAAAQMGIAEATDLVVNNLKVFGGDMSRAKEFTDVMAKTVTASNTDLAQLGQALSYSGATASVAGMKFSELNAILATMADQGVKGTRAGTQIRMAFTRLMKPTSAAQTVLEKYGISTAQITKLLPTPIKLFELLNKANLSQADALTLLGTRQANVFGIIKNGIPRMKELQKTIQNAGGTAEEMALIQVDTLSGALKLLRSAFEEIIISGSEGLLPVFKMIIGGLIKMLKAFIKLPGPIKAVIGIMTFLIPVILILTKVVMAFGVAFSAAIWPITLVVLAIGVLIAAVYLIKKHWGPITVFFQNIWERIAYEFKKGYYDIAKVMSDIEQQFVKWGVMKEKNIWFKEKLVEPVKPRWVKYVAEVETKKEAEAKKEMDKLIEKLPKDPPQVTVNNKVNIGNKKVHEATKDYIKEYNLRNFVYVG